MLESLRAAMSSEIMAIGNAIIVDLMKFNVKLCTLKLYWSTFAFRKALSIKRESSNKQSLDQIIILAIDWFMNILIISSWPLIMTSLDLMEPCEHVT